MTFDSLYKEPVMRKAFPCQNLIMTYTVWFRCIRRPIISPYKHNGYSIVRPQGLDLGCLLWRDDVTKWKHFPCYWPFVGEFTGHRWNPLTEASDAELWCFLCITMTSQWGRWRLKSPASRVFAQPFIRTQMKVNIKAPRHWPLCGEFTGDRWIPRTNGQ